MSTEILQTTLGALLAGCLTAVGLSAVLGFQTFLYFRIFPTDTIKYKILVIWIWTNDAAHTILICTTMWKYLVVNFNDEKIISQIMPTLALTVAITAIITLSANLFYGWRIHKMSGNNWFLTTVIVLLCIARTGLALTTTIGMLLDKTFASFSGRFNNVVIAGLSISAVTDIVVSIARYYYLRSLRQGYPGTQEMVDAVVVFTINDGFLTCAIVFAAITCVLRLPGTFVWIGIHFNIAKLYSNSILATLNLRNWYRHRHRPLGIPLNGRHNQPLRAVPRSIISQDKPSITGSDNLTRPNMEVFIDHQVEYNVAVRCAADDCVDIKNELRSSIRSASMDETHLVV